jgi:hypothetical protein
MFNAMYTVSRYIEINFSKIGFIYCRSGFSGVRRTARCSGSLICPSQTCPYLLQYKTPNSGQFNRCGSEMKCHSCEEICIRKPCFALKVYEFNDSTKTAEILHTGTHTCVSKRLFEIGSRIGLQNAIRNHPKMNVNRIVTYEMMSVMREPGFQWSSVKKLSQQFANVKRVQNMKSDIESSMNPIGDNFEALAAFKDRCNETDEFLVFKINNRSLNGEPSFVFKSSLHMAKMALELDRTEDNVMSTEYVHFDATHSRCRKFKTQTLWVYSYVMRKLLRLAVMEIESEDTKNLTKFWELMNEMLQKVSDDSTYKFNPRGYVVDEHHANRQSLRNVFGDEVLQRTVSCEFHFQQCVNRHAHGLGDSADEFKRLAHAMLSALSVREYTAAHEDMTQFITTHKSLKHWFDWWHQRRTNVFRAFKPDDSPLSNLAEVGHAKMATLGRSGISLLEAAFEDAASAFRQQTECEEFTKGVPTGGRGSSCVEKKRRLYKRQMSQATAFGEEVSLKYIEIF